MRKTRISIATMTFMIFWTLLLVGKGLGMSSSNSMMITMTWIAVAFAGTKLFLSSWKRDELIIACVLLLIGLLVFVKTHDAAVLLTVLSICAVKDIDLHTLFKYSFWLKCSLFIVRTSLAIANVIDSQILVRFDSGDIHTVRYALGYGQPNATHYTLFVIYVLLFLSYKSLKTWTFVIAELYNCFIFLYTNSRTGFIITSLLTFCVWIIKSKIISKLFYLFGKPLCYIYIWLTAFSFSAPFFIEKLLKYDSPHLGTALSRFRTGTTVLTSNTITLLGIGGIKTDFGFVFIGYQYGLIVLMLFVIANTVLMKLFFKRKYFIEFFIILIYSLYTIAESYSASILMNTSLILISILLFRNNRGMYFEGEK